MNFFDYYNMLQLKKVLIIFNVFLLFSCIKKNNKDEQLNLLLLYYLLNQPEPLSITCEDIPANQPTTTITTLTEDCSINSDTLYSLQWHFTKINMGTSWQSYCGSNISISVIDDGIEINHEDLTANIEPSKSYDYSNNDTDPTGNPSLDDSMHGTAVSGLIAAKDNTLGVRGVAPRSKLRGYNAIKTGYTSNIIDATKRDIQNIWISNNSWGPPDGTGYLIGSDSLWQLAVEEGLTSGRFGLGTIYVFAAGNGAYYTYNNTSYYADNSNYDGYSNYHGVISVCAVGDNNVKASYSEKGANLWLCAPSMGDNQNGLVTTDLTGSNGLNSKYYGATDLPNTNYTKNFNGTSGSTPIVSGAIALMLQANPSLTWRDVRYILAKTTQKNDPTDSNWTTNAAGIKINHKYGFGLLNVSYAVNTAKTWTNFGGYRKCVIRNIPVYKDIVDNGPAAINEFDASFTGIKKIEWVDATVHLNHGYWGDLLIQLYSPSGTEAILMEPHNCSDGNGTRTECQTGNMDWRFGIARFLDETAEGKFRISVQDKAVQDAGYFKKWDLTIYGRTN